MENVGIKQLHAFVTVYGAFEYILRPLRVHTYRTAHVFQLAVRLAGRPSSILTRPLDGVIQHQRFTAGATSA